MKNYLYIGIIFITFFSCLSAPDGSSESNVTINNKQRFTGIINDTALNNAIIESYRYISNRINERAVLGIANFNSPTRELSEYYIDGLTKQIVDNNKYKLVDIGNIRIIEQEMSRHLSGNISDATAKRIGHQYGTDYIVIGNISQLGTTRTYRIKITITNVETTQIQGIYYADIRSNSELAKFLPENTSNRNTPLTNTTNQNQRIYFFRNITQSQFYDLFDAFSAEARAASRFGNASVQAYLQDGGVSDPYIEYKVLSIGVISITIAGPYYSEVYVYGRFDVVDKNIAVNRLNVEKSIINAKYGNPDIYMFFGN